MTPVVFSPEAREDLGAALLFLKQRRPRAAESLAKRIDDAIGRLAKGEFEGPYVRLTTGERIHRWPVIPYLVYYERRDGTLWILRIYHGKRDPIET